jgi:hypothetical protein
MNTDATPNGQKCLKLPVQEIINLYRHGESSYSIALKAGCSGTSILTILRSHGIAVRKRGQYPDRHNGRYCTREHFVSPEYRPK